MQDDIKTINDFMDSHYGDTLSEENFLYICEKFNEELFGDYYTSREIFESTVGTYGYDIDEAPVYGLEEY